MKTHERNTHMADEGYSSSWLTVCLLAIWFFLLPAFIMAIVALVRASDKNDDCGYASSAKGVSALAGGHEF